MSKFQKTFQYGKHAVTLETGEIARQASASVMVHMGDTVVLVTVVAKKEADPAKDFLPLMVIYQEKTFAAGKIPGGFLKREGKPSERETLISRLIDRPLRPLFPASFTNEIQVIATVLSLDPEISPDIPAMIGASAAVTLSGVPFEGPIAGARVGYVDGAFLLNPSPEELKHSLLDLVVSGTQEAVLMVESQARELPEKTMLEAVQFGHAQMQVAIKAINELKAEAGKSSWNWQGPATDEALNKQVEHIAKQALSDAYRIQDKVARIEAVNQAREKLTTAFAEETDETKKKQALDAFSTIEKNIVRGRILAGEPRIDGRDHKTVRPISVKTGAFPRTHGSAIFTRGETQALVFTTLGTSRDSQIIDALEGEYKDGFMLHYNFPPYSVGEVGMMMGPKRREIGHGRLARRAIEAVLPDPEVFPYVLRIVSEITESNGSSSMATVCGASLSLMDAGVPIKAAVAGVAMGLIKENNQFKVLTDILGDEDHLGDMDFKVAGTANGVTALQMDIKIIGITPEIMAVALEQALQGRLHILGIMNQSIQQSRTDLSIHAPRIFTFKIHPDKIRDVIGKGGVTIRSITEETGASIDIDDDGTIKIYAIDGNSAQAAQARIESITADVEIGKVYEGTVVKIVEFGAFVEVVGGKQGLVHVSQISNERVNQVSDVLHLKDKVKVKVIEIDNQGRIRLSMKAVTNEVA